MKVHQDMETFVLHMDLEIVSIRHNVYCLLGQHIQKYIIHGYLALFRVCQVNFSFTFWCFWHSLTFRSQK